jgi:glycine C-acetyltransferase
MIRNSSEFRDKLWTNVRALQNGLRERGFNIGDTTSPVTPVLLQNIQGGIPEVTGIIRDLRENLGIFCSIVVYPVVPKDIVMLRIIPTAAHTLDDVQRTLDAFSQVSEKIQNGTYRGAGPMVNPKELEVSAESAAE